MKRSARIATMLLATAALLFAAGLVAHALYAGGRPAGDSHDRIVTPRSHDPGSTARTLATRVERDSMAQVQSRVDPEVFNALGPSTYYISRMELRPPGDALAYVEPLRLLSRQGDALATFKIYLAVKDCKALISRSSDRGIVAGDSGSQRMSQLVAIERKLSECTALLEDHDMIAMNWISLAAEQGSIEARLIYSMDTNAVLGDSRERLADLDAAVAWRQNAIAYLQEVAGTGNLDAMVRLSNAYEQGVMVPKDPQRAYAYALVSNRIQPDANREYLVRSMEEGLSIKQRESAVALSHQIYHSCCQP